MAEQKLAEVEPLNRVTMYIAGGFLVEVPRSHGHTYAPYQRQPLRILCHLSVEHLFLAGYASYCHEAFVE